jgi:hypothetical protein
VERALHLDVEHELEAARGEVFHPGEVGDGGVADQDVRRAELPAGLGDQPLPVPRLGQVGADRRRGTAGRTDLLDGLGDGAGERRRAGIRGPGRYRHRGTLAGEPAGDLRPDAAAGAGHDGHLAVQDAHGHHSRDSYGGTEY